MTETQDPGVFLVPLRGYSQALMEYANLREHLC
jgi:hypothetical protein